MPGKPEKGPKMKKRPLAYITAAWSNDECENADRAAKYCDLAYKAGLHPFCPILNYPMFLKATVPQEHKDMKDMAKEMLRRSAVLVVCGSATDEDVMDDIAMARRFKVTTTTLDGIMLVKGKSSNEGKF